MRNAGYSNPMKRKLNIDNKDECLANGGTWDDATSQCFLAAEVDSKPRPTTRLIEHRNFKLSEVRVNRAKDGKSATIEGHAAVFNKLSEDLGGFKEKVAPGAFKKTIKEADVRALFNHDENYVLGRNRANTLTLEEDETGLRIVNTPPSTQWATDLITTMERGDVDQMSFGFYTILDSWEAGPNGDVIRTLLEVELFDVSVVTFPAYPQTDASVRSIVTLRDVGIDLNALAAVAVRAKHKMPLSDEHREFLRSAIESLNQLSHSPVGDDHEKAAGSLAFLRRRQQLLEATI